MSLLARLVALLGGALLILWLVAASWLWFDLRQQMESTLDQRLQASAEMVAGLVTQLPAEVLASPTAETYFAEPGSEGVACQVQTRGGELLLQTRDHPPGILEQPAPGFQNRDVDGTRWRLFTLLEGELWITTADRLSERELLLSGMLKTTAVPFLFAFFGGLITLWLGLRHGLQPLQELRNKLAKRTPNDSSLLTIQGLPHELQPVVETLNELLTRNASALSREQEFTSNAAHQLRTPLTAIKTHLQVARRQSDPTASLIQATQATMQLHNILEQLLLMARMDGATDTVQTTCTGAELVAGLRNQQPAHGRVHWPATWPEVNLYIPLELALVAVGNIIDNAIQHTPTEQAVEISWDLQKTFWQLSVRDYGPRSEQFLQQQNQLRKRFQRAGEGAGTGLGLAITDLILQHYSGTLHYQAAKPGLVASITIPRCP